MLICKLKLYLMKYLITLSLFIFSHAILLAQDTTTVKTISSISSVKLDTNRVVYDESGNALRYYQYNKLIYSGAYSINYNGNPALPTTKAFLKKISPERQVARDEMIKKIFKINNTIIAEGKTLDLAPITAFYDKKKLENKPVVLIFWYAGCPPCIDDFGAITAFLQQTDHSQNLSVIAVTPDVKSVAETKLKEKPLAYATLISSARSIADAYQIKTFPAYIVTDKNHVIKYAMGGSSPITIPELKNAIKNVLQQ